MTAKVAGSPHEMWAQERLTNGWSWLLRLVRNKARDLLRRDWRNCFLWELVWQRSVRR